MEFVLGEKDVKGHQLVFTIDINSRFSLKSSV